MQDIFLSQRRRPDFAAVQQALQRKEPLDFSSGSWRLGWQMGLEPKMIHREFNHGPGFSLVAPNLRDVDAP